MCKQGHTIFQNKCKACQSLKLEYYQLLKEQGFIDIENGKDNPQVLDKGSTYTLKFKVDFKSQTAFDAKMSYFTWAREKLSEGRFKSERDKLIWEAHTEGFTTRRIAPMVGIEQSWCVRSIHKIRHYLKQEEHTTSSSNYMINIFK